MIKKKILSNKKFKNIYFFIIKFTFLLLFFSFCEKKSLKKDNVKFKQKSNNSISKNSINKKNKNLKPLKKVKITTVKDAKIPIIKLTSNFKKINPTLKKYYAKVLNKKGKNLKKVLHQTISNNKILPYKKIWKYLDQLNENKENPNNITLLYTGRSQKKSEKAFGKNSYEGDYWNREHVWPQSHGFKKTKKRKTPKTDLHNIFPSDRTVNISKSDKDFNDGGIPHKEAVKNKSSKYFWNPRNKIKGNIARILFYMDVRYEGTFNEPDLELVDYVNTKGSKLGKLCTLYKWHFNDIVDKEEKKRNEAIYKIQKNRNPFIDYPNWVESIWGNKCKKK